MEVSGKRFRRLYLAITPVGLGLCVGALIVAGVVRLMQHLYPLSGAPLLWVGPVVWLHAMIGLASFGGGVAAAWLRCWGAKDTGCRRQGGAYGFAVAGAWCIGLTSALWRWAVLMWPLFLVDLLLVVLAGVLGQRMSREA